MIPSFLRHILRVSVAVLFALSLTLVSCRKDPDGGKTGSSVSISADKTSIPKEKAEFFLRVKASAAWTAALEYADEAAGGWASLSPFSGSGDAAVVFKAQENTGADARSVRVVITSGEESASVTITQAGKSSEPEPAPQGGWLEMPETPSGSRKLLVHDMDGQPYVSQKVSGLRNWSCWWDPDEHLSIWVAYPLNNAIIGSASLSQIGYPWGFDPCTDQSSQPNIIERSYGGTAFGGGNWNRGHQIPRADRRKNYNTVASTCYPTNMTPQDGTFNGGVWASLEDIIRGYASRTDTLYVVTGCTLSGSSTYTANYSGWSVKVPSAYWKAVVGLSKTSRQGFFGSSSAGFYCGCAYYLPHDPNIGVNASYDYILSIDDLEKKIGIDLFVNLPGKIGEDNASKLEALAPGSFWK